MSEIKLHLVDSGYRMFMPHGFDVRRNSVSLLSWTVFVSVFHIIEITADARLGYPEEATLPKSRFALHIPR